MTEIRERPKKAYRDKSHAELRVDACEKEARRAHEAMIHAIQESHRAASKLALAYDALDRWQEKQKKGGT